MIRAIIICCLALCASAAAPAQAETALFNAGQILFDLTFRDQAKERFKDYLQKYPQGKHRNNVETLLRLVEKQA